MTNHNIIVNEAFKRAQSGDREAVSLFLEKVRPHLLLTCYRLIGNPADAEDATQEALIQVLEGLAEAGSSWRPLLFGSALRAGAELAAENLERKPAARRVQNHNGNSAIYCEDLEPIMTGHLPLDELEALEAWSGQPRHLRASLAFAYVNLLHFLPSQVRATYVGKALLGLSEAAVANALGLSESTVLQHYSNATEFMQASDAGLANARATSQSTLAQRVMRRLVDCLTKRNLEKLATLLDEEVVLILQQIGQFTGMENVVSQLARSLEVGLGPDEVRHAEINGQPALVCYQQRLEGKQQDFYAFMILMASLVGADLQGCRIVRLDGLTDSKSIYHIGSSLHPQLAAVDEI